MGEVSNMKFCRVSLFFALLVAACLPAISQTALRVNVPFNFIAAGTSLPAGHYRVVPLAISDGGWRIFNDQTGASMLTMPADSKHPAHHPSLVFLKAGGAYSLVQMWNWNSGVDVPQSHVKQTLVSKDESKGDKYVEIAAE
jgi:hypothetical protein